MIANLQTRKETIQEQVDNVARQFEQSGADNEKLTQQMARLSEMKQEHFKMQELIGKDKDMQSTVMQRNILMAYNKMLANSVEPLLPTLSDHQQEILDNSGYNELTGNSYDVINCAMLLALEYIHAATNYAESHGGGGSPGTGWGRDKDEDDEHWWLRCVAQSATLMHPKGRKKGRVR